MLILLVVSLVSLQNAFAQITLEHGSFITLVSFSPDGTLLASVSLVDSRTVKLWDVATGENIATLEGHKWSINSVAFSPDGTLLAAGSGDNTVKLWDVSTHENIATLDEHRGDVNSVAFSPDGTFLASGSDDDTVKLWSMATYENITTLEGHSDWVNSVAFSPDGTLLASGDDDGTVKLWSMDTHENIATLEGQRFDKVELVAFSPDGTLLASVNDDGTVKLWSVDTHKNIATFEGQRGGVNKVAFSPDGTLLVTLFRGVKLWDVATHENIATLDRHGGAVSVAFSIDGSLLATGSVDGPVKLWDVATHENIATLEGHSDLVNSVMFSPDGELLVSESYDETVKLWNLTEWTSTLEIISGNIQEGTFDTTLPNPLVVEVKDRYENPIPDVKVTFKVTRGGGQLSKDADVVEVTTDENGRAAQPFTLGPDPGRNSVRVTIANAEVTFTATGLPYRLEIISGNNQEGTIGTTLANPLVVEVKDRDDNPIPDVKVTFKVTQGGGLLSEGADVVEINTDENGRATQSFTLGPEAGRNSVRVTIANAEVSFNASGLPYQIEIISGNNQEDTFGTTLPNPLVVEVKDHNDNPIPDVKVTFKVTQGGGLLSEGADVVEVNTDENGRAAQPLTLGPEPGRNSVEVSITGSIVTFYATGLPYKLEIISGDNQEGTTGTTLANPLVIEVSDHNDKPIQGVKVTFKVYTDYWNRIRGGGLLSDGADVVEVTTDEYGRAAQPFTLGPEPGTNSVEVSIADAEVTFYATGLPYKLEIISGNNQEGTIGTTLPNLLVVEVRDHNDNPISDVKVTFKVYTDYWIRGGGLLSDGADVVEVATDEYGRAAQPFTLGPEPGTNSVEVSIANAEVTFYATGLPYKLEIISGDNQEGTIGTTLPNPLVVEVRDHNDNPIQGAKVSFEVTRGGGQLSGGDDVVEVTTDENGRAEQLLTLGADPGTNSVRITITHSTVIFNITGLLYLLEIISGNNQEGVIGTTLPNPLVVEVRDRRNDNLLPDVKVTFKISRVRNYFKGQLSEGAHVVEVTTDENGRAAQPLTLDSQVGRNSVEVSIANSIVRFDASGVLPYQLEIISGDNQQVQFDTALAEPLVVELRDWQGNLLPDKEVTFKVTEGDALLNGVSDIVELTTDANGLAALSLVLGYAIENAVVVSIGPESVSFSATGNSSSYSDAFPIGHAEAPSMALSPDGTTLAIPTLYTNEMDQEEVNIVELWDVETRTIIATLEGHTDAVWSLSFSSDGTLLATGSGDNKVKLWDVATHTNITTLEGHSDRVQSLAFSPDGVLLVSGAWDGVVKVWDVATQQNIVTFGDPSDRVSNNWFSGWYAPVAFSPDGTTLAYGAVEEIKFWDVTAKQEVATIVAHPEGVISLSFSSDGTMLASHSADVIKLWNVETHEYIPTSIPDVHDGILQIAFVPNSTILAYTSYTFNPTTNEILPFIGLWDVKQNRPIANLEGHTSGHVWSLSFSSDGTILASSSEGVVKLWDMVEAKLSRPSHLVKISGEAQQGWLGVPLPKPLVVEARDQYDNPWPGAQVTFTVTEGDGRLNGQSETERVTTDAAGKAAISLTLGNTKVNSVEASLVGAEFVGNPLVRFNIIVSTLHDVTILDAYNQRVTSVVFSPDGTFLAFAGFSNNENVRFGTVKLWNLKTKTEFATLRGNSVAYSPDGALLAYINLQTVRLWDVETRQNIATLDGHTFGVFSVAFSPDGTLLASGGGDNKVKLWDVATHEILNILGEHWNVSSVAFSPDGTLLASGGGDDTVKLWDVATHENIATLEGHSDRVRSVAFSPDGTLLASGALDQTVKLWDVATHENIAMLEGHADAVRSVAFSPDGNTLVSKSSDGSVKLWDVDTKQIITTLEAYTGNVLSVAFSPDGKTLAAGTGNGTVELWDISSFTTISASPETPKEDVNKDGVVNMADLVLVASNYGQTGENVADVNGDGVVHIYDIILVASQIDTDAAAPSLHTKDLSMPKAADIEKWLSEAQQLNLTDATSLRGILFLQRLLDVLTPKETALLANYPNPFNPETWIPYHLSKDADVTLTIYNMRGVVVRTIALGHKAAGVYTIRSRAIYWDGKNAQGESVASGMYFYTLTTGDFSATRKMLIRK